MKKLTLVALVATYFLSVQTAFATPAQPIQSGMRAKVTWTKMSNNARRVTYAAVPAGQESLRARLLLLANRFTPVLDSPGIVEVELNDRVFVRMVNDGQTSYVNSF